MSDPTTQPDLTTQIMKAPAPLWTKIKKVLAVQTREQAATMAASDDAARQAVLTILAGGEETALTGAKSRAESFLTSPKREPTPLPELMYGKGKAKVTF